MKPDIAAPGGGRRDSQLRPKENLFSGTSFGSVLDPQGDNIVNSACAIAGTSMATPHVAGIMCLWKEMFPDITSDMVKAIFRQMSGQAKNNVDGYGLIDATWILSAGEAPRASTSSNRKATTRRTQSTVMF